MCSSCLLCHFCSCKPRGRGLVFILPLAGKSAWVWGLPHHFCYLLISSSGIFPSLHSSISLFLPITGCKRRTPLKSLYITSVRVRTLEPAKWMLTSKRRFFSLLISGQLTEQEAKLLIWGFMEFQC